MYGACPLIVKLPSGGAPLIATSAEKQIRSPLPADTTADTVGGGGGIGGAGGAAVAGSGNRPRRLRNLGRVGVSMGIPKGRRMKDEGRRGGRAADGRNWSGVPSAFCPPPSALSYAAIAAPPGM